MYSFFNPIADGLEEVYENAHAKIREDPNLADPNADKGKEHWKVESDKYTLRNRTHKQRREAIQAKIAAKRSE